MRVIITKLECIIDGGHNFQVTFIDVSNNIVVETADFFLPFPSGMTTASIQTLKSNMETIIRSYCTAKSWSASKIEWQAMESNKVKYYTGTTTGGVLTISMTETSGDATFDEINFVHIEWNDNTVVLGKGWTISPDRKTLTITMTKQAFGALSVLGNLLFNSVAMSAAPNGTQLFVKVEGK